MVTYADVSTDEGSPFPAANVARVAKAASGKKSAVLVARSMQYLLVRVMFHGTPVAGLKVQFGKIDDIDDQSPEKMEPVLTTDEDGLACFPRLVVAGIYSCEIERQPATIVPTVGHLQEPYPVVLPIGRPLVDVGDVDEFLYRPAHPGKRAAHSAGDSAADRIEHGELSFQLVHAAAPTEPLEHARVNVTFPDGSVREFETDDTGFIHLGTVPTGEYQITPFDESELLSLNNS
jgi:hypothetical protein